MEYAVFQEKVRRTVYVDSLSPHITEAVLRKALEQFGTVKGVQFIPNYMGPNNLPQCALVEMKEPKEAKAVISVMTQFPFMISGIPRPVRARAAEKEMFDDRPKRPGLNIHCRWLSSNDPDFEVAKKLKQLVQKHTAESAFALEQQLIQEEKLAKQQGEALNANHKKYEMVDNVIADGAANKLTRSLNPCLDSKAKILKLVDIKTAKLRLYKFQVIYRRFFD
ncbi:hypothetical protein SLE2022_218120 [Rubroshorea leprosula]